MELIMGIVFVGVPVIALFIALWIHYTRKQPSVIQSGNTVAGDMCAGDVVVIQRTSFSEAPKTPDLRGSKAITTVADTIVAVQRPRAYDPHTQSEGGIPVERKAVMTASKPRSSAMSSVYSRQYGGGSTDNHDHTGDIIMAAVLLDAMRQETPAVVSCAPAPEPEYRPDSYSSAPAPSSCYNSSSYSDSSSSDSYSSSSDSGSSSFD